MNYDLIVVGSGFFGLTVAERMANRGLRVLVLERRPHIGGYAYGEVDEETGIEVPRYGPHLFHPSSERVWDYVHRFPSFTDYQHHVFTNVGGDVFQMPINHGTVNHSFRSSYSPR